VTYKADLHDFARLEGALDHNDPSEVHGLLCGMLCANNSLSNEVWLDQVQDELTDGGRLSLQAQALLKELFNITVSQLQDDDLGFALLLPADQDSLSQRTDSLGYWCQGFLAGLVLGGMDKNWPLSPEVQEFFADLVDICRLGLAAEEGSEEDEEAYMEIVEYVRMGVLLVNLELRSNPPAYCH
jgi:yecA family protein